MKSLYSLILFLLFSLSSFAQINGMFNYGQDGHVYFYLANNTSFHVPVSIIVKNTQKNQSRRENLTIWSGNTFFFGPNYNWSWEKGETITVIYNNGQSSKWVCPYTDSDVIYMNNLNKSQSNNGYNNPQIGSRGNSSQQVIPCFACHGNGLCQVCNGTGTQYAYGTIRVCPLCQGKGICTQCGGKGGTANPYNNSGISSNKSNNYSSNVQSTSKSNTINGHEYVDLGLPSGTKWATMNIGAKDTKKIGNLYAWGETKGFNDGKRNFSWETYKYCKSSAETLTKYHYGKIDKKKELDISDDAAYIEWGSSWRIPTKEQFEELFDTKNCTYEYKLSTDNNDISGYLIKSKRNGKSIFFPAGGCIVDEEFKSMDVQGYYWTRSLKWQDESPGDIADSFFALFSGKYDSQTNITAFSLWFSPMLNEVEGQSRYKGMCIRPVTK